MQSGADMKFDFKGLKAIDKAIQKLPKELHRKAYRSVISTGARVIAKHAKKRVPIGDTGLLKRSIGIKAIVYETTPYAVIGPKMSVSGVDKNGDPVKPWKYAHLVERGTYRTAAKPFIRPAMDESGNEVINKMAKGLDRFLTRAVKKVKATGKY